MGHDDHDHPHHHHLHHHHRDHGPTEPSQAVQEHRAHAPAQVATFVITSSDSRDPKTDESGALIRAELEKAGHPIAGQALVKDDPAALRAALEEAISAGARAIIVSGGTGIGRRDVTCEVVGALLEKRLDGFGELFRMLSFEAIGPAAMLSRAVAGTWRGALVFALPGSPAAARLALAELILPELGHAVRELMR